MKRKISDAQCARVAMAADGGYRDFMEEMQQDLSTLIFGREHVVKTNWDWVRQIAKKRIAG